MATKKTQARPKRALKTRTFRTYHEILMESLRKHPEEARLYLNEALKDEDSQMFLIALRNVIEALYGSIGTIAKKTNLNRENLYRILSEQGNPEFKSMRQILGAMGMHLSIEADAKRSR